MQTASAQQAMQWEVAPPAGSVSAMGSEGLPETNSLGRSPRGERVRDMAIKLTTAPGRSPRGERGLK